VGRFEVWQVVDLGHGSGFEVQWVGLRQSGQI
jgi:hypothetical protein